MLQWTYLAAGGATMMVLEMNVCLIVFWGMAWLLYLVGGVLCSTPRYGWYRLASAGQRMRRSNRASGANGTAYWLGGRNRATHPTPAPLCGRAAHFAVCCRP